MGQGLWGANPSDVIDVRFRTTATDDDGNPATTTPAGAITANLTHVVYTRDANGNVAIYTNDTPQVTATVPGTLTNWDGSYLGNELTGDRPWLGTFHLVAIYDRALAASEIHQNYTVGPTGGVLAPIIAAIPDETTDPGVVYIRTPVLSQGTPPITWSLLTGPDGMTIDPATGRVTWTDPQPRDSSHPILIRATNTKGSDEEGWTLTVADRPPIIVPIEDERILEGAPYNYWPALSQGTPP